MHDDRLKRALDRRLASLDWTERDTRKALAQMRGELKVKKRMTFALALTLALVLLAATAFAIGQAVQAWLNQVADMEASGVLAVWELDEKLRFVRAMREAGYAMDEGDWALLADEAYTSDERSAAADRIIDARYGDLMQESVSGWIEPPDSVVGMAPDPIVIFKEAYDAEHPEATEQEYADALGYWLRDVARRYEQLAKRNEPEQPAVQVDAAYVEDAVRGAMTEIYSWPEQAARGADITATYLPQYGLWEGVGVVRKELVKGSGEMITDFPLIFDEGDSYRVLVTVDTDGAVSNGMTPEEFYLAKAGAPIWNYTEEECRQIATRGLADKYGMTREAAELFFVRLGDKYKDAQRSGLYSFLFKAHNNTLTTDWAYACIVNAGTGEMIDCFTPEDMWLPERLERLAEAYPDMDSEQRLDYMRWYAVTYDPYGGFRGWSPERKAAYGALFKPIMDAESAASSEYSDIALEATRRVYGVPGEGDLTLDAAVPLARRAGEQALGLEQGALDRWGGYRESMPDCSFDVTDPDRPVWRFVFTRPSGERKPSEAWLCHVVLDARTGEVIQAGNPYEGRGWTSVVELL